MTSNLPPPGRAILPDCQVGKTRLSIRDRLPCKAPWRAARVIIQYESRQISGLSVLPAIPAKEAVKELTIGWISGVRSSRQPLGDFLGMRNAVNAIEDLPHTEERPWARLEAREDADAALAPLRGQFLHTRKRETRAASSCAGNPWTPPRAAGPRGPSRGFAGATIILGSDTR